MVKEVTIDNSKLQCIIQECPRKYYFKYIHDIAPAKPEAALNFGQALHKMCDAMFSGWPLEKGLEAFRLAYPEDLDEKRTVKMGELITREYYKAYAEKQPFDEVIALEQGKILDIVDEKNDTLIHFYCQLDKIVKWIYGITVIDHKTSSKYLTEAVKCLGTKHQFTGYIAAVKEEFPEAFGLLVDFIYVPRPLKTKDPQCAFDRPIVTRAPQQIDEWKDWVKMGVHRLHRLTERDAWHKFDNECEKWNRICPYYRLCDLPIGHEEALAMAKDDPEFITKRWAPWEELPDLTKS